MKAFTKNTVLAAAFSAALLLGGTLHGQSIVSVTTFATGTAVNSTKPDSICSDGKSIWVAYGNTSVSTGGGNSTVVEYDLTGTVKQMFTLAGSVDGLKADPKGILWALQNQDGNSTLTYINPKSGIVGGSPFTYAVPSATQGYDDVVFEAGKVFASHTNPAAPTDAIIQYYDTTKSPLSLTDVLLFGATGTNLATGAAGQPLPDNDPDSLKATPAGGLMLSSGDDGALIFVNKPATLSQEVAFLQLIDSTGANVSGLDDAVFPSSTSGTFFVTDTNNNQVIAIKMTGLKIGSLYASVGSLNAFTSVDLKTGKVTPLVGTFNGPHGILFLK